MELGPRLEKAPHAVFEGKNGVWHLIERVVGALWLTCGLYASGLYAVAPGRP
jgi:hypothetical protein